MTPAEAKFLLDPYLDWTGREGIPVHEGQTVDLHAAETGAWPRFGDGCKGAFVHLDGRGDWMTVFLIDLPPGGASAPQRHLYDEIFVALSGAGQMIVEAPHAATQTFDVASHSVFAPPLNARYRVVNASSQNPLRLACANDLRILINIYHDEAFFFDNPFAFPERSGNPGRLSEASMDAQVSDMPARSHQAAERSAGVHVIVMQGTGYSLLWHEGSQDFRRVDWRPGLCFVLPENAIHQHFVPGAEPARHLAIGFGTTRHPIVQARRADVRGIATDAARDARVNALWLEELRKGGRRSEMTHGLPSSPQLA